MKSLLGQRAEESERNRSLLDRILDHPELADLDPAARRLEIRRLASALGSEGIGQARDLADVIDGFGPLTSLMADDDVTDVLVNGPDEVWVERAGRLERTSVRFRSDEHLRMLIDRCLGAAGSQVDLARPLVDARLADGSRIHVALPPVAPGGPLVSIRRFPRRAFTIADLVARSMLTAEEAATLVAHVQARRTVLIGGPTGSGKTTLLAALLGAIGPDERVVLLEETDELPLTPPHVAKLVARSANSDGSGAVSLADLVRASLRMRPDRLIVGEVRGEEAMIVLRALSAGHRGSLLTIHSLAASSALRRLVSLAVGAGLASESLLSAEARAAVDVVVQLGRDGTRRRIEEISSPSDV